MTTALTGHVATLTCVETSLTRRNGFRLGPLTFDLRPGVTCLVGPNGAGKSTLFRLLVGLERPDSGVVRLGDDAVVGYLPQSPAMPARATPAQFLTHVAWLHRIPRSSQADAVAAALAAVDLSDLAQRRIETLSGGMVRRLGIAQALVHRPSLILLDEPTVGLDPAQRAGLRETIAALGVDTTVLVSTHLVEDVRSLADRVLVVRDGSFVFDGTVTDLEGRSEPGALGDTPLERALTTVIGRDR